MRPSAAWESARIGLAALRVHPLRTLLSTMGIVIGVLSLVATLAVIDGVDAFSRALITRETSVQEIVVSARRSRERDGVVERVPTVPPFTLEDWHAARRISGNVLSVALTNTAPAFASAYGHRRTVQVVSGTANLADFSGLDVSDGRFFTETEVRHHAAVAVLNHRLALELAGARDALWLLGRQVRLGDRRFRVIGVLAERQGEADLAAFVPLEGSSVIAGPVSARPTLRIKAASIEAVPSVRDATIDWLAERFGRARDALDVNVGLERLQRAEQGILVTKMIFGFLVTLMLVVGGTGVMNVLLASIAERTREIGIRKAVGASARDIRLHFLAESLAISGMGAVVGAALGTGAAAVVSAGFRFFTAAPIWPVFKPETYALVVGAAATVGIMFGTYPALVAGRLSPIDAIQRD